MCQSAIQWIVFSEMFRIFTQTNRDLSNFKGRDYGGRSVPENGIESRVLKLAMPEGATQSQLNQLMRLIDYAQQNNVQLNIVLAK